MGDQHTFYVVQRNDLETSKIVEILEAVLGFDSYQAIDAPWGTRLTYEALCLPKACRRVVLVEIGGDALATRLREEGFAVERVDHKHYSGVADDGAGGPASFSALEQIIELLRPLAEGNTVPAQRWEKLVQSVPAISANERGGIPHLARTLLQQEEARRGKPVAWTARSHTWPEIACLPNERAKKPYVLCHALHPGLDAKQCRDLDLRLADWDDGHPLYSKPKMPQRVERRLWATRCLDLAIAQRRFQRASIPTTSPGQMKRRIARLVTALSDRGGPASAKVFGVGKPGCGAPCLVLACAPLSERLFLYDAVYAWVAETHQIPLTQELEILALFTEDASDTHSTSAQNDLDENSDGTATQAHPVSPAPRLRRLEFYAGRDRAALVSEAIQEERRRALGIDRLEAYAIVENSVTLGLYDAIGGQPDAPQAISRFADHLLDNLLIGNRPVDAWRLNFLQPLRLKAGAAESLWERAVVNGKFAVRERDSGGYFLPHVERVLAPDLTGNNTSYSENELRTIEVPAEALDLEVEVTHGHYDRPLRRKVRALRLHLFYFDTAMLEWVIEECAPDEEAALKSAPFWRRLLCAPPATPLAVLTDFSRFTRMTYSDFASEEDYDRRNNLCQIRLLGKERRILGSLLFADAITEDCLHPHGWLSGLLWNLLSQLGVEPEKWIDRFTLIGDYRARSIVSVVLPGNKPDLPSGEEELIAAVDRLRMADSPGRGFSYSDEFARNDLEKGRLRRHEKWGSYFAAADHCFTYLGFGKFARDEIHGRHMPDKYRPMALLAQFYTAIMHSFSVQVTDSLQGWNPAARTEMPQAYEDLLPRFLKFVNLLWFDQLSSQIQGVEMFDTIRRPTMARREYELIKDEIERTQGYWDDFKERRAEGRMRAITVIGIPIGALLTVASALPEQSQGKIVQAIERGLVWVSENLPIVGPITTLYLIALGLTLLAGTAIMGWPNWSGLKLTMWDWRPLQRFKVIARLALAALTIAAGGMAIWLDHQ